MPLALLTYLHCSRARSAGREHLANTFWATSDPGRARQTLRQNLSRLRNVLGAGTFQDFGTEVRLIAPLDSDRDRFLAAVSAHDLDHALTEYRGPFFPDYGGPRSADFEHWVDAERERLRLLFLQAGEARVRRSLDRARPREAEGLARRLGQEAPDSEPARRLLIEVLYAAREIPAALADVERLLTDLREAGPTPEPATARLVRLVREGQGTEDGGDDSLLEAEMVGREREFHTIVGLWREAAQGRGRRVHLEGRAGIGKTRLFRELVPRIRSLGGRAVLVGAKPGDRHMPSLFAADLVRELCELPGAKAVAPGTAALLVGMHPALAAVFPQCRPPGDGEDRTQQRALALVDLLSAVSEECPVAILLDDLHWLDEDSRRLIDAALPRLADARVLSVTASRPGGIRTLAEGAVRRLLLAPLTLADSEAFLASLASIPDPQVGRRLAAGLHRATSGSPLLLLESLQLALDEGWLERRGGYWKIPDPDALIARLGDRNALDARVAALPTTARRLLLTLAATGVPLGPMDLERASESGVISGETFADLQRRGYVAANGDRWDLAHHEIGEAVLRSVPESERRAAHAALGKALADRWGGDGKVARRAARHLIEGGAEAYLAGLFRAWVKSARDRGDWVSAKRLAREFLAELATPGREELLVRALPVHLRWPWKIWLPIALVIVATVAIVLSRSL